MCVIGNIQTVFYGVYLVDPSTGTEYYMPRMVVIPIFYYQSGNAPQIFPRDNTKSIHENNLCG